MFSKQIIALISSAAAVTVALQAPVASAVTCTVNFPNAGQNCAPVGGNATLKGGNNGPGGSRSYAINWFAGPAIPPPNGPGARAQLLNSNGTRTQKTAATGGGNCPEADDPFKDGSFGPTQFCTTATVPAFIRGVF
jgi:hypothetical protein